MRMWWRRHKDPCPEALQALEESRKALEETQGRSAEAESLGALLRAVERFPDRVEAAVKARRVEPEPRRAAGLNGSHRPVPNPYSLRK